MYVYNRIITIDNTKVSGSQNLTNYPMLFHITEDYLKTVANGGKIQNNNGYDIVFYTEDGATKLDHEIIKYNGSIGEFKAYIEIPTLNYNNDTIIKMFYSNANISSSQENITGTWNSNYKAVWHLDADILDSTINDNDLTEYNIEDPTQITIDNISASESSTFSHTTGSLTNGLLIVAVGWRNSGSDTYTVNSVTYNGQSLTLIRKDEKFDSESRSMALYYMKNPPSGTHDVVVTYSGSPYSDYPVAITFDNVDQDTPIEAHNGVAGGSGTAPSVSVTTVTDGALVLDALIARDSFSETVGANQTQRWDYSNGAISAIGSTELKETAGSTIMSWSFGSSELWSVSACAIRKASALLPTVKDTGYLNPSANGDDYDDWPFDPEGVYAYGGDDASPMYEDDEQDYYNFGISIPTGATVTGIEVNVRARDWDEDDGVLSIELSHDGGSTYTSTGYGTGPMPFDFDYYLIGGSSNLWGRSSWTATELNNTNFRLKMQNTVGDNVNVDHIQVKVYYNLQQGISYGREFNGITSYMQSPYNGLKTANNFMILGWFKTDVVDTERIMVWEGDDGGNGFGVHHEMHAGLGHPDVGDAYISAFLGSAYVSESGTLNTSDAFSDTDNWHQFIMIVEDLSSSPSIELIVDGSSVDTDTGTTGYTSRSNWDTNLRLGRPGTDERYFDGKLASIKILETVDKDLALTIFNNENNPSTFFSLGTELLIANTIFFGCNF